MRHSNSMTETLDHPDASMIESFLKISMIIAAMAVGAGVCSGVVTLALMS